MSRERGRFAFALLLSLLLHAPLLSLTFGGHRLGLPGFGFSWRDRPIEAPELRVVLAPRQLTAAAPEIAPVAVPPTEKPVTSRSAATPSRSPAPRPGEKAIAILPAARNPAEAESKRDAVARTAPAKAPTRAVRPDHAARAKIPKPRAVNVPPSNMPAPVARGKPSVASPVVPVPPIDSSPETVTSALGDTGAVPREAERLGAVQEEVQRREAERQETARLAKEQRQTQRRELARQEEEAARIEAARRESERQEAARLAAEQRETQRREFARQDEDAARIETARREAERLEAARMAAEQLEAQRRELARQEEEAARGEAMRREAEHQKAARLAAEQLEAQRQEGARLAAAQQEAARLRAGQDEAKREERLRAIGRQLDEEAARRDEAATAPRPPSTLPLSLSTARRARLFGRTDPNAELVRYAEAWAQKILLNTPVETVRDVATRLRINPMVTIAVRSDGSVESVTFVLSSGVAEVDEAIRRIVRSHEHYQAFPPALARDYDVIEIRRTWHFDSAVRLY